MSLREDRWSRSSARVASATRGSTAAITSSIASYAELTVLARLSGADPEPGTDGVAAVGSLMSDSLVTPLSYDETPGAVSYSGPPSHITRSAFVGPTSEP